MQIEFYLPPAWPGVGAVAPKKTAAATKAAISKALAAVGKPAAFGANAPCAMSLGDLGNALFFDTDNGFSIGLCRRLAHSSFELDPSGFLIGQQRLQWLQREKRRAISELVSCALVLAARQPAHSYVASCADLNQFFTGWAPAVWEKRWRKAAGPDYVICDSPAGQAETATFVEVKGRFAPLAAQPAGSSKEFASEKTQSMNARFRPEFAPAATRHVLCYATIDHAQRVALQTFNHDSPEIAVPRLPAALPVAFCQFARQLINAGLVDAAKLLIEARGHDADSVAEALALEGWLREVIARDFSRADGDGRFWRSRTTAPERLLISDTAISVFTRIRLLLGGSRRFESQQLVGELRALDRPDPFAPVQRLAGWSPVGTAFEQGDAER